MLDEALDSAKVGVCVKDRDARVLLQNDICRDVCGLREGSVCTDGCMMLHADDSSRQWKNWGCSVYRNSHINDGHYDVTLICSDERIVTFLQPLDEIYQLALAHYRDKGLTRRELEVVSWLIRGKTNAQICEQLTISRATLRTHLNSLYGKLREHGESVEFLPGYRVNE